MKKMSTETIIAILETQIAQSNNGLIEITNELALQIINKMGELNR